MIEPVEVTWAPVRKSMIAAAVAGLLSAAVIFGITQEWIVRRRTYGEQIPAQDAPLMAAILLAVCGWSACFLVNELSFNKGKRGPRVIVFSPHGRVLASLAYAAVLCSMTMLLPLLPDFPDDGSAQSAWHDPAVVLLAFLGVATLTMLNAGAMALFMTRQTWAIAAGLTALLVVSPLAGWFVLMRPLGMPVADARAYVPLAGAAMVIALGWAWGVGLATRLPR
ncbi:hypothetical protein [Demetria terragena]|uniref:hypothetical protein n=1 Tax=Demetria terragena TaxID=63959 RepID=UPI0003A8A5DC|nr:hypothetical protein [Demetria terragena]